MSKPNFGVHSSLHLRRLEWLRKNRRYWSTYDADMPGAIAIERLLLDKMKAVGLYKQKDSLLETTFPTMIYKIRSAGRKKKKIAQYTEDD